MSSSIAARCVFKTNEEIEIYPRWAKKKKQPQAATYYKIKIAGPRKICLCLYPIARGFEKNKNKKFNTYERIYNAPLSLSYPRGTCCTQKGYLAHICMMHACGVRFVFLEHGALDTCKSSVFAPKYGPLSASATLLWFVLSLL